MTKKKDCGSIETKTDMLEKDIDNFREDMRIMAEDNREDHKVVGGKLETLSTDLRKFKSRIYLIMAVVGLVSLQEGSLIWKLILGLIS